MNALDCMVFYFFHCSKWTTIKTMGILWVTGIRYLVYFSHSNPLLLPIMHQNMQYPWKSSGISDKGFFICLICIWLHPYISRPAWHLVLCPSPLYLLCILHQPRREILWCQSNYKGSALNIYGILKCQHFSIAIESHEFHDNSFNPTFIGKSWFGCILFWAWGLFWRQYFNSLANYVTPCNYILFTSPPWIRFSSYKSKIVMKRDYVGLLLRLLSYKQQSYF